MAERRKDVIPLSDDAAKMYACAECESSPAYTRDDCGDRMLCRECWHEAVCARLFPEEAGMTDEDIKRGLALCEAATPGPWFKDQKTVWAQTEDLSQNRFWATVSASPSACSAEEKDATAAFIAAARTLLPEALRELERLRRVERAARNLHARIEQGIRLVDLDDVRDTGPLCEALRAALEEA